jgi:hypothetical protein
MIGPMLNRNNIYMVILGLGSFPAHGKYMYRMTAISTNSGNSQKIPLQTTKREKFIQAKCKFHEGLLYDFLSR